MVPVIVGLAARRTTAASHAMFLERYVPARRARSRDRGSGSPRAARVSFGGSDDAVARELVRLAHLRFSEEPGAISDQLYWRRREGNVRQDRVRRARRRQPWVAPPEAFNSIVAQSS